MAAVRARESPSSSHPDDSKFEAALSDLGVAGTLGSGGANRSGAANPYRLGQPARVIPEDADTKGQWTSLDGRLFPLKRQSERVLRFQSSPMTVQATSK
jgi:hypothetical protein